MRYSLDHLGLSNYRVVVKRQKRPARDTNFVNSGISSGFFARGDGQSPEDERVEGGVRLIGVTVGIELSEKNVDESYIQRSVCDILLRWWVVQALMATAATPVCWGDWGRNPQQP